MTQSTELIHELRASRPVDSTALRERGRQGGREKPARVPVWSSFRLPVRRVALVALPAAAALALVSAGAIGLSRSDGTTDALSERVGQPPAVTANQEPGATPEA